MPRPVRISVVTARSWSSQTYITRISAFVDYGNVFARTGDFSLSEFRVTTGVALQWQSPVGPISISYALPLRKEDGDEIERLQFTFGNQQ